MLMRVLFKLVAQKDQMYEPEYHHKLRGVLWDALENTEFSELHGEPNEFPFSFSNPFPVNDMDEGDMKNVVVASPHPGLIEKLEESFEEGDEFNIGERSYSVDHAVTFEEDVGEPGSSGVLETSTGLYVPLPADRWDEYGINPPYNADKVGWTNEYDTSLLLERLAEDVERKQRVIFGEYMDVPESGVELFEGFKNQKQYSVTVPVTSAGYEYTFVVSKWRFEYQVRDDDHRRWLNMLLNTGMGWRNSLGFGFVNKVSNNDD